MSGKNTFPNVLHIQHRSIKRGLKREQELAFLIGAPILLALAPSLSPQGHAMKESMSDFSQGGKKRYSQSMQEISINARVDFKRGHVEDSSFSSKESMESIKSPSQIPLVYDSSDSGQERQKKSDRFYRNREEQQENNRPKGQGTEKEKGKGKGKEKGQGGESSDASFRRKLERREEIGQSMDRRGFEENYLSPENYDIESRSNKNNKDKRTNRDEGARLFQAYSLVSSGWLVVQSPSMAWRKQLFGEFRLAHFKDPKNLECYEQFIRLYVQQILEEIETSFNTRVMLSAAGGAEFLKHLRCLSNGLSLYRVAKTNTEESDCYFRYSALEMVNESLDAMSLFIEKKTLPLFLQHLLEHDLRKSIKETQKALLSTSIPPLPVLEEATVTVDDLITGSQESTLTPPYPRLVRLLIEEDQAHWENDSEHKNSNGSAKDDNEEDEESEDKKQKKYKQALSFYAPILRFLTANMGFSLSHTFDVFASDTLREHFFYPKSLTDQRAASSPKAQLIFQSQLDFLSWSVASARNFRASLWTSQSEKAHLLARVDAYICRQGEERK